MASGINYEAELIVHSAEVPSSPLGSALRRVRRARAFPEIAAGKGIEVPPDACAHMPDEDTARGLSQEELDALCVVDEMPTHGSPRSETSSTRSEPGESHGDGFLLRARRMRAFLSAAAADAFAADMMAKVAAESQGSTASTSPSRVSPRTADAADGCEGLSQAELDRLSQKSTGLSQNELDALSTHYGSQRDEACNGHSSPGPADACYWIRRSRAFQSREGSMVQLSEEAHVDLNEVTRAEDEMDNDAIPVSMSSPNRRGKTQEELDKLCIESPEGCANSRSPKRDVDQIATPQRKRRSDAGGALIKLLQK